METSNSYDIFIQSNKYEKNKVLTGRVLVPSSKSICHRALICAALSSGESYLSNLGLSDDIRTTISCLETLGAQFELQGSQCKVQGITVLEKSDQMYTFNCNESGSTLRFMIPIASCLVDHSEFNGKGKLKSRPLDPYFDIFKATNVSYSYNHQLPLLVEGHLKGGYYRIPGNVSSQFISGLLMAAPLLNESITIEVEGLLESKQYVDLTLSAMNDFGVMIQQDQDGFYHVEAGQSYQAGTYVIEADYSQAAFWIVAGVLAGPQEGLLIQGLNPFSLQGDMAILEIIEKMGAVFEWVENGLCVYPGKTTGAIIDGSQCPDIMPIVSVLAAFSEGETRIINSERLRIKESDRILAMVTELKKIGVEIDETPDGMKINGSNRRIAAREASISKCNEVIVEIDGWNDHRIVMSMAVAALRYPGTMLIRGAHAVSKSYPNFFEDYRQLGGDAIEQHVW